MSATGRMRSPMPACLAAAVLLGSLLAGCSSAGDDDGATDPASATGQASATGPASRTPISQPTTSPTPAPSATNTELPVPAQSPPPAPPAPEPEPSTQAPPPAAPAPPENSRNTSVDNPTAVSVVVNKHRPLNPLTFAPADLVQAPVQLATSGENALLRAEAAAAGGRMFDAAAAEGIQLTLLSGYRSYNTQIITYNGWVNSLGSAAVADTVSARPGHSEHQTGLALDVGVTSGICSLSYCFSELPASAWIESNAHRFGYIVRYQIGHHLTTGFYAEPWHLRYVGAETATAMITQGIPTLEQFFGLPAAPDYR